jgi:repressor LexA
MKITERRKEILAYLEKFQQREGFPPSIREICSALDLKSPGSLHRHLRVLEERGCLEKSPGKKRAWKLTEIGRRIVGRPSAPGIPLIGRIAAGTPILAEENKEDELPVDPTIFGSDAAFALRVQGDSMKDAQIRDRDLAIIRPREDADSGRIVAVRIRGIETEATLKILRRSEGRVELHPANDDYEPLVFSGEDCSKVEILGELIGVIRTKP